MPISLGIMAYLQEAIDKIARGELVKSLGVNW